MSDQIGLLEASVDFPSTKVVRFPNIVWIFGGEVGDINEPEALSFRDKFIRYVYEKRPPFLGSLAKPEDYPEWWNFAGYPDLLAFESDAAALSRLVVIFIESPGAWVELGAFAHDLDLCQKLLVVVPEKYRTGRSFIELGPLRRLTRLHPDDDAICVVQSEIHQSLDETELALICNSISARLKKVHRTENWDPRKRAHHLLLLADLADIFQAVRTSTLAEVTRRFGFDAAPSDLYMQGRLLQMLNLARLRELGTEKILCTKGRDASVLLDYQGLPNQRFDRTRFKLTASGIVRADVALHKALGDLS